LRWVAIGGWMKGIMRRDLSFIWEKKKVLGILEEIAKQIARI